MEVRHNKKGENRTAIILGGGIATVAFIIVGLAAIGDGVGCGKTELSGQVSVDGREVTLAGCRNGSIRGFIGVELLTTSGQRLRVEHTAADEATVVWMHNNGVPGIELGRCGWFRFGESSSTVNHIRNVFGEANLHCTANGHSVVGRVQFNDCH